MTGVPSLATLLILVLVLSNAQKVSADNVVATVTVGQFASSVAFDPVNHDIYVANVGDGVANESLGFGDSPTTFGPGNVSVISGSTDAVVAKVTVGIQPAVLSVDPANGDVYVIDLGNGYWSNVTSFGLGNVSVISVTTDTVIATVPVGNYPLSLAFDPLNGDVYVSNYGSNSVSVISAYNNTVVATLAVGQFPAQVAFDPSDGEVYVASDGPGYPAGSGPAASGALSVISSSTNAVVANVSVAGAAGPEVLAFDSANDDVYLANNGYSPGNIVSVISGPTNSVVATPLVGADPNAIAFNPSNGDVYVGRIDTNFNSNGSNIPGDLLVISGSTNTVIANVTLAGEPVTIAVDPASGNVYVATVPNDAQMQPFSNGTGTVSVVSESTNTVMTNLTVGDYPISIAVDSSNGDIYVANLGSDTVSVIAPTAISSTTEVAPEFPSYSLIVTLAISVVVTATLTGYARARSGRKEVER
jgi:YVTN family beta-propeller protein